MRVHIDLREMLSRQEVGACGKIGREEDDERSGWRSVCGTHSGEGRVSLNNDLIS